MTSGYKYADIVLSLVPRIVSSLDRNKSSRTHGCFDKSFWFYKTSDFPCARFQEPVLTLALLHKNRFAGNPFFNKDKTKEWAEAGIRYLSSTQNRDGSFNEWYPNEHSFVATAFSVYNASQAIRIIESGFDGREEAIEAFKRSARWLNSHHHDQPSNQVAGSVAALHNIYLLTGEDVFRKYAERKLREITQSKEGWLPEYGGPDMGYLTVAIDFLAKYWKDSQDKNALKIIEKALGFLKYFIHPDGSLGGVYGSRNTEFKLPHGFEIMSRTNKDAGYIAGKIYENIENTLNPTMMDDRFALQYHTSYLQAFLDFNPRHRTGAALKPRTFFPESGLFVYNGKYYMVINTRKGGVFKQFNKKSCTYEDSGFVGHMGKKTVISQWNNSSEPAMNKDTITVSGRFKEATRIQNLTPIRNIMFRSLLATAGGSGRVATKIKKKLRGGLIEKAPDAGIGFVRTIKLKKDHAVVSDKITNPNKKILEKLSIPSHLRPSYVPTSSFYAEQEIDSKGDLDFTMEFEKNKEIRRVIKP